MVIYQEDSSGKLTEYGCIYPCSIYDLNGYSGITHFDSRQDQFFDSFADAFDWLCENVSPFLLGESEMYDMHTGLSVTYSHRLRKFIPEPSNYMLMEYQVCEYGITVDEWKHEFGLE